MRRAEKIEKLERRRRRVRQRVFGTQSRPRLSVFRSERHIYAQLIDDISMRTLVSASSLDPSLRKSGASTGSVDAAKTVGQLLATRAKSASVGAVVFDRGGRRYHGRVKALAEASREHGLKF